MENFLRLHRLIHFCISSILFIIGSLVQPSYPEVYLFVTTAAFLYWFAYPFIVSECLIKRVSRQIEFSVTFFKFNWVISVLGIVMFVIAAYIFNQNEFHSEGFVALIGMYWMFAFGYSFLFAARILKTVEQERLIKYGESLGTMLLLLFFPFNFLFLGNRIKRALDKPIQR